MDVDPPARVHRVASLAAESRREAERVRRGGLRVVAVAVAEGAGATLAALGLADVLCDLRNNRKSLLWKRNLMYFE